MRVRITNSVGDPIHTKIIDDTTGMELKDATGVMIFPFDTRSKEIRAEITVRLSSLDVVADASLVTYCPHCNQKLKIIDYVDMLKYLPKGTKLEIKNDGTITAYWDEDYEKSPVEVDITLATTHKKEFIDWLRTGKQPNIQNVTSHYDEKTDVMTYTWSED